MTTNNADLELGMDRKISRRDFLNGVALGAGGLMASHPLVQALTSADGPAENAPDYYPPALTGMRGNHDGTYTFAHRLRDGESWESAGELVKTDEAYDLVVV